MIEERRGANPGIAVTSTPRGKSGDIRTLPEDHPSDAFHANATKG